MNIFILGSGNVAWHLSVALKNAGHHIDGVYSRNINHAEELAQKLGTKAFDQLENISSDSDLYIISVSDKAIEPIARNLLVNKPVVHTSGSVAMHVLAKFAQYGVFYPLQTFSRERIVDLKKVPFCIESNTPELFNVLEKLALDISDIVVPMSSEKRMQCHLAAVFANNFVNHFYTHAKKILNENQLSFDLIKPLIRETALKAIEIGPEHAQTGPARRGDQNVLQYHMELLSDESLKKMYSFVSDSIMKKYQSK